MISRSIGILLMMAIAYSSFAQQAQVMVYDFERKTLDALYIAVDKESSQKTSHAAQGRTYADIEDTPSLKDSYAGSEYAVKQALSKSHDAQQFPFSTAIKIFYQEGGYINDLCSGTMISNRHVLIAMHCLGSQGSSIIQLDSLLSCAFFDEGSSDYEEHCTQVRKAYFLKDWQIGAEDMVILELDKPLGTDTGYLGVGYESDAMRLMSYPFYKCSYPSQMLPTDAVAYNGDTLYYSHGKINMVGKNSLGVLDAKANAGESGSSLVHHQYGETYTIYGILNFSNDMRHVRITPKLYSVIAEVIREDVIAVNEKAIEEPLSVYPNPTSGIVHLDHDKLDAEIDLIVYDQQGRRLQVPWDQSHVDFSLQADGVYMLRYQLDDTIGWAQVIKN